VSLCLCGELLLSNVNHRGTETQRLHRENPAGKFGITFAQAYTWPLYAASDSSEVFVSNLNNEYTEERLYT